MEIFRDANLETDIINKICNNWGDNVRNDIHLSDLITPRKAFFNKMLKLKLTKEEIFTFLVGLGVEDKLGKLMGEKHGKTKCVHGIYYSPDFEMPEITELKSRRRNLAKEGEEHEVYDHYLRQLKGYLALSNQREGNLIVFSISERIDESNKTRPELAAYKVRIDEEESNNILEELLFTKEILQSSLRDGNFKRLPLCPDWLCGRQIKTMVVPPHCITCDRDFTTDYFLKKHKEGKKTTDHEVKYGEYEFSWEPLCKYFDVCGRDIDEQYSTRETN